MFHNTHSGGRFQGPIAERACKFSRNFLKKQEKKRKRGDFAQFNCDALAFAAKIRYLCERF